jgi:hypothetical protein
LLLNCSISNHYTGFWWGDLKKEDHVEDLGVDGNMKIGLQEVGWGGMDWIELAQYTDRWRALVNAVVNLSITKNVSNFLTS